MQTKLIAQYLKIEKIYKEVEEKRSELREAIVLDFEKNKIEKLEDPVLGSFTIGHKKSWTYSKAVKSLEDKVKIAKVKEQEKGVATSEESSYLVYTKPKDN